MNKFVVTTVILWLAATANLAQSAEQAIVDRYNKTCIACHASGAAGAPKTGDTAEWAKRNAKGMDALLNSVDKGLNAMPPKGLCFDCSMDEYKALIEYMVTGK